VKKGIKHYCSGLQKKYGSEISLKRKFNKDEKFAYRLPMLNLVSIPDGVDEAALRGCLLDEFGIEIGAGLGPLAGKVVRIGLMGHTAREENVGRLLNALAKCLQ
jgi:aspartate aminotransferase-like enzyme